MRSVCRAGEFRWGSGVAIVVAVAALLSMPAAQGAADSWTIAGYLSGDGDLSEEAGRYRALIWSGAEAAGWNAAVQIDRIGRGGSCLAARYLSRDEGGTRRRSVEAAPGAQAGVNMGDGATLQDFLRWVRQVAPAEHYALIVMGHGVSVGGHGYGERGGLADSGLALDATAGGDALSAGEIRDAIAGAGDGRWLDALFLDCCFGGSLEVAYELRTAAGWLCAAPGQVSSPGVQWDEVLRRAGAAGVDSGRDLVAGCLSVAGGEGGPELTGVELGRVGEVARALRQLSEAAVPRMAEVAPSVTLARSRSRAWGGQRELCDAGQFAANLAELAAGAEVRDAAREVADAVGQCLLGGQSGGGPSHGLAIFLPGLLGELPVEYTTGALGIAKDGAWGEFVAAYVGRLRELLVQRASGEDGVEGVPGG